MKKGKTMQVVITFTEPCLGTCPKNQETYADYIASRIVKRKDMSDEEKVELNAEEVKESYESIDSVEERGWTGFMRDDDGLYVYDYWMRGYFKSAIQSLMETKDLKKVPAYKTKVDRYVHIHPRKLRFVLPNGESDGPLETLERPLKAMTARGPRVSLARSDYLPVGTKMMFEIELLDNTGISMDDLVLALSWGEYEGLGQWRSGGYGKFTFEVDRSGGEKT